MAKSKTASPFKYARGHVSVEKKVFLRDRRSGSTICFSMPVAIAIRKHPEIVSHEIISRRR
jgi:hypothetical protein